MSLAKASLWTASSTLIKIGVGLVVIKLLALSFGPQGVGLAGNFRQLITVLGVLAGAGIFNGVTKYLAESQADPQQRKPLLGTASAMVLVSSTLLAVLFLCAARPISQILFDDPDYRGVIQWLALIQLGIAYANLFLAILKGYRDARGNALGVILGSLLGCLAYIVCFFLGGYLGALMGLALVPAVVVVPAMYVLHRRHGITWREFTPCWDKVLVGKLSKFTLMTLITVVSIPVAYVMMRNLLAREYTWHEVGLWQGVSTLSDAYLQFITATFTVYLLPTLARLTDKKHILHEIKRALCFVFIVVAAVSIVIWLFRDRVIEVLFSAQFSPMRTLFAWQLTGDVFKVGAFVFGYLAIAKASLRLYVLAEFSQFALLTGFSHWLIPRYGAMGATRAYMCTYILYFCLCALVFIVYYKRVRIK